MAAMDRSELEASPLADLHAIADQLGLESFRRLRKADLIAAILGEARADEDEEPGEAPQDADDGESASPRPRRRRPRRSAARAAEDEEASEEPSGGADEDEEDEPRRPARRTRSRGGRGGAGRGPRAAADSQDPEPSGEGARIATGVVEVLGNGSAFLRVEPPEPSDADVYISAAQVRRCELVTGDDVSGPVRTPRRSERYPSLVRVDTINGAPADSVSDGSRYDELAVAWPSERLVLDAEDPTLQAIEWLTPLGLGSRAVIVGARRAGKSETLRRLARVLSGREDLELSVVLAGARPEEIAEWSEASAPVAALSFAASADAQGQAVERAIDAAKRVAARGGNAVVLIDSLSHLSPLSARRALAGARNLQDGGSLTVIAVAPEPLGGETTVIALDAALAASGREPILDLLASGTLRAELLVGDEGAEAIMRARSNALETGV